MVSLIARHRDLLTVAAPFEGGAVVRNRARRRLREAVRSLSSSLPRGWDILLVIRLPGASATVAEFVYALDDLLRRRNIVAEAREE